MGESVEIETMSCLGRGDEVERRDEVEAMLVQLERLETRIRGLGPLSNDATLNEATLELREQLTKAMERSAKRRQAPASFAEAFIRHAARVSVEPMDAAELRVL